MIKNAHTSPYHQQTTVPLIACGCGCGEMLPARDKYYQQRRFIRGHHARKREGEHKDRRVEVYFTPADFAVLQATATAKKVPMARLLVGAWEQVRGEVMGEQVA